MAGRGGWGGGYYHGGGWGGGGDYHGGGGGWGGGDYHGSGSSGSWGNGGSYHGSGYYHGGYYHGYYYHGGYCCGGSIGFYFGPGFVYAYPYPYYAYPFPYYYPGYYPYGPMAVGVSPSPTQYMEQDGQADMGGGAVPQAPSWYYYCAKPEGYYPYVKACPGGWQRVPAQPPGS